MKTAVIFYSLSGNTAYVADILKEKLDADLFRIRPRDEYPKKGLKKFYFAGKSAVMAEEPELIDDPIDLSGYDQLILGTPVWAGTFAPPLRTFLKLNRDVLREKEVAVYVCCSAGGARKAIEQIRQFLQIDHFNEELILIDPKEKNTPENKERIETFCRNRNKEC